MLKKLIMLVVVFFIPTVMAAPANMQSPYQKTEVAANTIFAAINAQSAEIKANPEILKNIVKTDLLPYIHVKYAAALALGDNYKNVPAADRDAYFNAFEGYLVQAFAQALSMYNGQTYKIEPESDLSGKNIVAVRVQLISPDSSQQPIRLDFQWRKNSVTGEWQAYDMVAEGISMINTKQSEWATIVRQQGIEGLIKLLQTQSNQKIDPDAGVTDTSSAK